MGSTGGIAVIGESVVDRLVYASGEVIARPGGSPANVAVGLGRLGEPVMLITELGADADGDLIRAHLRGSGVSLVAQSVGRTSTAAAHIGSDGTATYELDISWTLGVQDLPHPVSLVHVGSLGAVMAPGATAVSSMLAPGLLISYDPNLRGSLQPGELEAVERMVARAHLIKASEEDLGKLHPGHSAAATARRWVAAGAALVVVTAAASGSTAFTARHEVHCPAAAVTLLDTVGAGDAFMAALLHHLRDTDWSQLTETDLRATLLFASRAAGIVCSRAGADPAWLREL